MGPSAQHHHPQESKWANSRHAVGEENNSKELSTHAKEKQDQRCNKGWKRNKQHWWDINSKNGLMLKAEVTVKHADTQCDTCTHTEIHKSFFFICCLLSLNNNVEGCASIPVIWLLLPVITTAHRLSNTIAVTNQERDYCFCYQAVEISDWSGMIKKPLNPATSSEPFSSCETHTAARFILSGEGIPIISIKANGWQYIGHQHFFLLLIIHRRDGSYLPIWWV